MVELYDQWAPADRSLAKKAAAPASFFSGYMEDLLLIERLVGLPSHQIDLLDFGMGWGFWARMAKALNFRVVGAELSQVRIDFARAAGISVTTDVRALPDESFHAIFADQAFEHLPEPADTMAEMARLLKPGGLVVIKVPHDEGVLENLLSPSFEPRHDALHPLQHINMFRRRTFDALGAVAGLEQIQAPITVSPLNVKAWFGAIRRRRRNARHQSTALYRKPLGSSAAEGGFRSGGRPRRQAQPAPDLHAQGAPDPRGQS
jgi:SAM-dependent methyltransferase